MKVLVLGGTGFIGRSLVRTLAETNATIIHVLDNYSRLSHSIDVIPDSDNCSIVTINADLTNKSAFKDLDNDYDLVFLLASVVGVGKALGSPEEVIRINSEIILNTLGWAKESNSKKLVFTSTSETYAGTIEEFNWNVPTDETVPLTISEITHPRFSYAITKLFGEAAFAHYANAYGFSSTIVRYHNVYGPDMGFRHVIPHLAQRFHAKESPFVIYGGEQTRAFCYIDDAVNGTILAATSDQKEVVEIFHIGNDEETTIEDLVKYAGEYFSYEGPFSYEETFPGSVARRCPNIDKARKNLGFVPSIKWEDGVSKTLKWYNEFLESNRLMHEKGFKKPYDL